MLISGICPGGLEYLLSSSCSRLLYSSARSGIESKSASFSYSTTCFMDTVKAAIGWFIGSILTSFGLPLLPSVSLSAEILTNSSSAKRSNYASLCLLLRLLWPKSSWIGCRISAWGSIAWLNIWISQPDIPFVKRNLTLFPECNPFRRLAAIFLIFFLLHYSF